MARSHGKRLFSRLAEFIGESGASSSDGQQVPLRPGIRTELRNFTEAIKESRGFFQGLYQSYSRPQRSGRNGDDLGDTQDPRAAVERALVGEAVTSQLFDDVLLSEWTKFFQDNVLGQQQGGDLFRGGLEDLLSRASLRQTNVQVWKELDARLETWAVERLDGYLADQDAIKLLTNRGEGPAMSQLQHVARSAYPWLCFDEAYDKPASLHPQALVGVQYEEAPIIKRFTGKQIEALWRIEPIRNDSGAIVVYAEKMAFPLYFVKALRDLHAGYEAVAKRDDLTILRRHTVANYLDLPVILPCDPEQAVQWFKMDRLVLEALLLNIFSPNAEGWVQYQYYEPSSHVRNTLRLPATLTAIAARLRREEHLEQVLRQAVHERTLTVFSQRELALRAISLADWTQNHAFPRREGESYVYLEHELAASITRLWRETAATRLDINPVDHPRLVEDEQKRLKSWAERSPISSRALASAEPCLLALPRETFDVVPAGGRQQG